MTSSLTTTLTRTEPRNTATESHKKQQHINMNMNSAGCSSVTDVTEYIVNIEYSAIAAAITTTTTTTNKIEGIDNVNVKRNATSLLSSHSPAHKSPSRIPCPLNCNKQYHRSASMRLRDIQRTDALSVKYPENLVNETSTTTIDDQRVSCETGVTTAGNKIITRPKLVLKARPPSNTNILLKRSLSLRRNYKVPVYSNDSDSLRAINNKNNNKNPCLVFNGRKSKAMSLSPALPIHYQVDDDINCKELVDELESVETIVRGHSSQSSLQHNEATEKTSSTATITYTRPVELAASIISTSAVNITSTVEATVSKDITDEYVKPSKIPANIQKIKRQQQQQQQQQQQIPSKIKFTNTYKATPKTPPVTPISPTTYLEDDLDSLYSYGTTTSGRSTMSCEHPYVARNGTTFSGRKMKYVVHCSNYAGQVGADYLTPTQRAQRQVRRLKELLYAARHDLEQKDADILRLTREVVELRLFKASLSSPDERSTSSDAITVREADLKTSQDVSPIVDMVDDAQKSCASYQNNEASHAHLLHGAISLRQQQQQQQQHLQQSSQIMQLSTDMQSSFADSGHFEDMTSSSVHSKDSSPYTTHNHDQACSSENAVNSATAATVSLEQYELQRQELIRLYEQRIEELVRNQDTVTSDIKRTNNDRIEALLQKLAECNTRYADIVPDYEHAKERIRELEKQLEDLQYKLAEQEEKQKQMYLHMYQKGQEAERIARADKALELAHRAPQNKVSITELLHQLQSTQDELENIRAAECRKECGSNHALLTAKEAISLWVLGARKTIYRRLLEAQKNRTHVDPEVTLQFLKSAVYYFLTDKENSQGHLDAIESILEFSETERQNISKARARK